MAFGRMEEHSSGRAEPLMPEPCEAGPLGTEAFAKPQVTQQGSCHLPPVSALPQVLPGLS